MVVGIFFFFVYMTKWYDGFMVSFSIGRTVCVTVTRHTSIATKYPNPWYCTTFNCELLWQIKQRQPHKTKPTTKEFQQKKTKIRSLFSVVFIQCPMWLANSNVFVCQKILVCTEILDIFYGMRESRIENTNRRYMLFHTDIYCIVTMILDDDGDGVYVCIRSFVCVRVCVCVNRAMFALNFILMYRVCICLTPLNFIVGPIRFHCEKMLKSFWFQGIWNNSYWYVSPDFGRAFQKALKIDLFIYLDVWAAWVPAKHSV